MTSQAEKDVRRDAWESLTLREQRAAQKKRREAELTDPNFNRALVTRAQKRMARVDAYSPELRAVVHEFGLETVEQFVARGFKNAHNVAFLIKAVLAAENPYSSEIYGLFLSRVGTRGEGTKFLLDTILGADFPNGQRRFKLNKGRNAKRNILDEDDDDEAYFLLGPAITKPNGDAA